MTDSVGHILINPATRRDLEAIADLIGRSDDWVSYAANRGGRSDTWIWAARLDGRLSGLIDLREAWIGRDTTGGGRLGRIGRAVFGRNLHQSDAILQPYRYGRIHDLVVANGAQYHDIGTALINHCIQQMQHSGIEKLQIELTTADEAAQELCRDLGFHIDRYLLAGKIPEETIPTEADIRLAESNDLPQLADLVRQQIVTQLQTNRSLQLIPDIDWERHVASKLRSPDIMVLVCAKNGQMAGYLELRTMLSGRGSIGETLRVLAGHRQQEENKMSTIAYFDDIFIEKTSRRQGVAMRLVKQAFRWCRQLGIEEGRTAIWAGNQASLTLTRRFGKVTRVQLTRPL